MGPHSPSGKEIYGLAWLYNIELQIVSLPVHGQEERRGQRWMVATGDKKLQSVNVHFICGYYDHFIKM